MLPDRSSVLRGVVAIRYGLPVLCNYNIMFSYTTDRMTASIWTDSVPIPVYSFRCRVHHVTCINHHDRTILDDCIGGMPFGWKLSAVFNRWLIRVLNANGISLASAVLQGSLGDRPTDYATQSENNRRHPRT